MSPPTVTRLRLAYDLFLAVWAIVVCGLFAYFAYIKLIYTPPPPVPCVQGMTLQPGQSCYLMLTIEPGTTL